MKTITFIVFIKAALLCSAIAGTVPFSTSPLQVVLEPTKKHDFRPDASHFQDGKLVYSLSGQVFTDDEGKIAPATGTTSRSTPWETLSELLAAYHAKDPNAIRGLYVPGPDSDALIQALSNDPQAKQQWLALADMMKDACVLLGYQQDDRFISYVRFQNGGTSLVLPFTFHHIGTQYLLSQRLPDSKVTVNWNLTLALVNFQMKPSDIVIK